MKWHELHNEPELEINHRKHERCDAYGLTGIMLCICENSLNKGMTK